MIRSLFLSIALACSFAAPLRAKLEEFIAPEDKRYTTFRLALELMEQRGAQVIVETGTARDGRRNCTGDGCSTPLLAAWAVEHGAFVYSVDIDPVALEHAAFASAPFLDHLRLVQSDSVQFLKQFQTSIDFLYLDSYDFDQNNPLPSQEHHLREIMAAYPYLTERSIVLIDDCALPYGGKGRLAIAWLLSKGWKIVAEGYQVLMTPRINAQQART